MTGPRKDLAERIQLLVDGRLSGAEREQFEREIAADPVAREQLESMRWLKQATREALVAAETPEELESSIRASLDLEDALDSPPRRGVAKRVLPWLAAAAVLFVAALLVRRPLAPPPDVAGEPPPPVTVPSAVSLVLAAADDIRAVESGSLVLEHLTADVVEMEAYFATHGIEFETRVFDLGMMELTLVGGVVHELSDRPSAAFAYRRGDGTIVLCQMFRASANALPDGAEVHEKEGIRFYSYRQGGVALTFWQEGDVLCVLGSLGDPEEVLQLAVGKAVKV